MTVDLERQLDAYGDHLTSLVDHVSADEALDRAEITRTDAAVPSRRPRLRWLRWAVPSGAVVLVALLAATLGSMPVSNNFARISSFLDGADSESPVTTAAASETTSAPGTTADPGSSGSPDGVLQESTDTTAPPPGGSSPTANRSIIYTADMSVAVADVPTAVAEATAVVESLGGVLFGEVTRGGPEPTSVLTFRVLPERFEAALTGLGTIGELREQNRSADDVTDTVVDLQSRISTAEASVLRLRELMGTAGDVADIAKVEEELLDRETELERLRGRLRTIDAQVSMASITVTLRRALVNPDARLVVTAYPGHDRGASCPGSDTVSVTQGEDVTVCFEVRNRGDVAIDDIRVSDTVLEVETADLISVAGDPARPLPPGQSVFLAAEIEVDRELRTQSRMSATPIADSGDAIAGSSISGQASAVVMTDQPEVQPGFRAGLGAGGRALRSAAVFASLVAGALLPFTWAFVLVGIAMVWRRRKARPI